MKKTRGIKGWVRNGNHQQRKRLRKWLAAAAVLLVLGAAGAWFYMSQDTGLPVEAYEADTGEVLEYVEDTAYALSRNERIVYSDVTGILESVLVAEGDALKAGDVLAVIEGKDMDLQIKGLSAQLEGARASASYASVQAALLVRDEADRTLENTERLYAEGAVSEDAYLSAKAAYEAAVQSHRQAISQYNAAVAQAETLSYEIDLLESTRDKLTVSVGEDTLVTRIHAKTGEYVSPGMPLFELGSLEGLYLEAEILVSDMTDVEKGQPVLIDNEDIGLEEVPGIVSSIAPKAFGKVSELGIEQKRVRVEIESEALKDRVRLGYEVDVRIITKSMESVLRVPDNAVFELDGEPHVFRIENGKAALAPVKVLFEGNDYFAVENGIAEGDAVILSPGNELEDGAKVSILED